MACIHIYAYIGYLYMCVCAIIDINSYCTLIVFQLVVIVDVN